MEEKITLASFDFDTGRLEESLERLQGLLFDIQKEQKRYRDENSRLQKQYDELDKQQQELVKRRQTESQQYKDIVAQMRAIETQQKGVFQSQKDLQIQQSKVNKEYQTTANLYKNLITGTGELVTVTDALNTALTREINTRAEAKKNNKEINALKDQLNVNDEEQLKLLDQLNEKVNQNNNLLKESGSQYEKQISNVGNYKNDIKEAFQELNIFNGGLGGFISRADQAGGAGKLLTNSLKQATTATIGLTKSVITFMATPLGAVLALIIGAFALIKNAMTQNQESANKLSGVFTTLGKVFSNFLKFLEPIGTILIDGIVAGFELAMAAAQKAITFFAGVAEALGFEDFAQGLRDYAGAMETARQEAQRLVEINNQLLRTQASYNREVGKLKEAFKEENKIAEDTSQTLKEREQAVSKSIAASERLQEIEVKRLELEKERAMLEEENAIQRDIIASEYEQKINEINASALEAQTTQNNKLNIIRQQAVDQEIKRQQELLALFIEQQGFKARTLEEELKLSQDISKKQEAILKKQLANQKISQIEYNKEILKLRNDLLFQQAKIASEQGKRELEEFIKTQQSILREGELYTDESLNEDLKRLNSIADQRKEFERQQFESGLINEREYEDNKLAIQEEYLQKSGELRNKYLDQHIAQEALRQSLEFEQRMISLEEQGVSQYEMEQAQLDFKYQEELLKLQKQRDNNLITESNYLTALNNLESQHALVSKQIEFEKEQAILNAYQTTFGGIATLLGERTAMGKAAGLAEAIINTWAGVNQVWATPSILPEPFATVQRGVSTGVVIKSGLESVKKITSTKVPKPVGAVKIENIPGYATGGLIEDGISIQRSNGDNRLITAKTNEVILNEAQRSIIGDNALVRAGVPGIVPSSNQMVQDSIINSLDMSLISEAVRIGALEGSYQGASRGSQDGIVGLSENRMIQQQASF